MSEELNLVGALNAETVSNYLKQLVNQFFKILPLREANDSSLGVYMESLQRELYGCASLLQFIGNDAQFLSLLAKLQWMIDHPDYRYHDFRREVFSAISICNKLRARYSTDSGVV